MVVVGVVEDWQMYATVLWNSNGRHVDSEDDVEPRMMLWWNSG